MKTYRRNIVRFFSDEQGASSVEYGLLVTLIVLAIMVGVGALGLSLSNIYRSNGSRVAAALP